jgi:phage tail sheath gpL-like
VICKNNGIYGEFVKISFNEDFGQEFPVGLSVVVTQPTGASGGIVPGDSNFFNILGLDDEQNEKFFTDLVISTPYTSTILDRISQWNGIGNDFNGNYAKLVQRPLRCLFGDIEAGSTGYNNLLSLGNDRKNDRTNGILAVPGSPNHPQEIAAFVLGDAARINNRNAAEHYSNDFLTGVWPGAPEDRWTSSYNSRDRAVKAGISPTIYEDGAVKLQNIVTFYHPDSIPSTSNGYRSMRAISVLQNLTNSVKVTFKQEKWQRISIVEDVEEVTDLVAKQKVKDKRAVENEVIALARAWAKRGWIYSADFTINRISTGNYVQIRAGGTGFDIVIPVILSGEVWILDTLIQFDTALTVFTA